MPKINPLSISVTSDVIYIPDCIYYDWFHNRIKLDSALLFKKELKGVINSSLSTTGLVYWHLSNPDQCHLTAGMHTANTISNPIYFTSPVTHMQI